MTPAQRALILAALGLTPRDGVMPRWSRRNISSISLGDPAANEWDTLVQAGHAAIAAHWSNCGVVGRAYRVTRLGAEAAGVLGRCRREDLGNG